MSPTDDVADVPPPFETQDVRNILDDANRSGPCPKDDPNWGDWTMARVCRFALDWLKRFEDHEERITALEEELSSHHADLGTNPCPCDVCLTVRARRG